MGVTLIWPIALSLLAGGIVIMYLLKQHAEEFRVPSLFLWSEMYKNQTSDKPWEKLKKNILLILEIIAILVMVLALMGPYVKFGRGNGSTVMVIIDNSASMETRYKNSESRLESAKKDAENFIRSLPADTLVTVISSNTDSNVLVSATSDRVAAIAAVREIKQTFRAGSCEEGFKTARALYNAYKEASIVLFTDTYLNTGELNASIYDFSGDAENVGIISAFSEDNGDDTFMVLAVVENFGSFREERSVDLYEVYENGEKKMVSSRTVTLEAGKKAEVIFDSVTIGSKAYAVSIGEDDDLAGDNVFYAPVNMKKTAEILLFTKEKNTFLEKAIKLVDGVKLTKSNSMSAFNEKAGYDLYILDCVGSVDLMNDLPADGNIMIIGSKTGLELPADSGAGTLLGQNDYGQYSFRVNRTRAYMLPNNNTSLFETQSGSCAGFIGETNDRKMCVIGFDFHETDFPLTMNFPIFIYDTIKRLTDTKVIDKDNVMPGDTVRISLNGMAESVVIDPKGHKTPVKMLDRFAATEEMGCYFVKGNTDEEDAVFPVNFVSSESNVGKMTGENSDNVDIKAGGSTGTMNLRNIIIVLALIFLIVDWIIYIRQ